MQGITHIARAFAIRRFQHEQETRGAAAAAVAPLGREPRSTIDLMAIRAPHRNMKLRMTATGLIAQDAASARWARLAGQDDLLGFLAGGHAAVASAQAALATAETADPAEAVLPFRPRSMRAFMLWECARHQLEPDAASRTSSPRRRRRSCAATSGSPAGRSPSSSPTTASARRRPSTSPTTPRCWPTARTCGGPRTRAIWTSSSSSRACWPSRWPTPRPSRRWTPSAAGSSSTTGARATCRPTTRAATSSGR